MLIAEDIQVEWDEGGCYLLVDGERWLVSEPEQLYDRVKAAILPWLMERDQARDSFASQAQMYTDFFGFPPPYDASDPKHPDHHDTFSAISDDRDAFDVFTDEDR